LTDRLDGECFRCHVQGIGFTFRGAHLGRKGWNEGTVMGEQRELYADAKAAGVEMERMR
jgi:hypothetical protein